VVPDNEVSDFATADLLPGDLGIRQEAADGGLYGPIIGLGWMLRDRAGPLQDVKPFPEILQLRKDGVGLAALLRNLDL
jgi:hypothetical protein